jgi:hypothetical protein
MAVYPANEKSPLPPFSKGGSKDDGFKSPFVKGGFRGICKRLFTLKAESQRILWEKG